ncbi:hypothetical protein DFH06DRAFT_1342832 [Mycena polygramma]|nr:hypothetical protein DFH06DRAFT_1342832 [Mycena polygramma]
MFSKILILGLSALSLISAVPTQLASNNGPLKTPGLYQIRQPAPGGPYNFKYVSSTGEDEQPLQVLAPSGHEQYLPMWWLRTLGADAFYLEPYGYPGVRASASIHSKDCDDFVLGSENRTLDYTWAVESAGENLWIIKFTNADLVWKATQNSTIKVAPADGAENERWELNYYGGP